MRRKKRTIKLTNVDVIRNLKLKAIQLNAVDPSKVYVIELNEPTESEAAFGEKAQIVTKVFKRQGIQVIVVPPETIKIYKLGK